MEQIPSPTDFFMEIGLYKGFDITSAIILFTQYIGLHGRRITKRLQPIGGLCEFVKVRGIH